MGVKSWLVTLTPLAVAIGQTVKSYITGEPLTEQEIDLIGYLVAAFIGSGIIGQSKSIASKLKAKKP